MAPLGPSNRNASTHPVPLSLRCIVLASGPADAVGDGQAGEHGGAAAVEFKAIQGPGARRLVVGHRPGPEASCGSQAPSFIRTSVRSPSGCASSWIEPASSTNRNPVPAASTYPLSGGSPRLELRLPVDRDCLNVFQGAIGAQRSAVHRRPSLSPAAPGVHRANEDLISSPMLRPDRHFVGAQTVRPTGASSTSPRLSWPMTSLASDRMAACRRRPPRSPVGPADTDRHARTSSVPSCIPGSGTSSMPAVPFWPGTTVIARTCAPSRPAVASASPGRGDDGQLPGSG